MALSRQKRVEIAKDVLKQLRANRYTATCGTYVTNDGPNVIDESTPVDEDEAIPVEVQPFVKKLKSCKVCAKGAIFVSKIRLFNKFKATFWSSLDSWASEEVEKIFGSKQAGLIEAVFENDVYHADRSAELFDNELDEVINSLSRWEKKYGDDRSGVNAERRLSAIMRNIIRNEGVFVIENV